MIKRTACAGISVDPQLFESLGLVGSGGKYLTNWGNKAGLDMDKEIQSLQEPTYTAGSSVNPAAVSASATVHADTPDPQ